MKPGLKRRNKLALAAFAWCTLCGPAHAWGLKTHLWIAEKILAEVRQGCTLDLGLAKRYALNEEACRALQQHPAEFRAGVLGPDVFPDFIVGQVTTHPGSNAEPQAPGSKWASGQYMSHLLQAARTPAELAFAYGYIVHGAGDVFAHTYVNNYAGDVFDLGFVKPEPGQPGGAGERRVELRHVALEKYIERHTALPPELHLDNSTVHAPTAFVTNELILSEALRNQYSMSSFAKHVRYMSERYRKEGERKDQPLIGNAETVLREATAHLDTLRKELSAEQGILGRLRIGGALSAMSVNAARARLGSLPAADAVALLGDRIGSTGDVAAPAPTDSALEAIEQQLRTVNNAADSSQADAQSAQTLGTVLKTLQQLGAESSAEAESAKAARAKLIDTDALVRAAQRMQQDGKLPGAAGALSSARSALADAKSDYSAKRQLRIASLNTRISFWQSVERYAAVTHAMLRSRQALRDVRIEGMRRAANAYIDASMQVALDIMNGQKPALSAYNNWRKCWAMVYAGIPYEWLQAKCTLHEELEDIRADIDAHIAAMIARLPSPLRELARQYAEVKAEVIRLAKDWTWNEADMTAAAITKDQATVELVRMLTSAAHTEADLTNAYQKTGEDKKDLLILNDIVTLVHADLNMRDNTPQPEDFQALRHSVTLAKLSLLDLGAINTMVRDHMGDTYASLFRDGDPLYPSAAGRSSILPLMVKSIDGNHQWQAYGIPYPRSTWQDQVFEAAPRRYGYNAYTEPGYGMRLFADPDVRKKLFARLFPQPFIGAINGKLLDTKLSPFVTCSDVPFPVTTLEDGQPAADDKRCPAALPGGGH